MLVSVNPATGDRIAQFPIASDAERDSALSRAVEAQAAWARSPLSERRRLLEAIAGAFRRRVADLAALATAEMGKPLAEAVGEINKCAACCEFYAENLDAFLAPEAVASGADRSYVVLDPLGVVLAVMPWNYPFWQVVRFAAPALAAGNGIALKHAGNVQGCAQALGEVLEEAGIPAGLFCNLRIPPETVEAVIADPRIAAVTLTGSTAVGSLVASQAGRHLKKQVLELGGSDPFIVLDDADVEAAAEVAVKARFQNTGQSCIAAKRFIVQSGIADAFVRAFTRRVAALVVGDPTDPGTTVGPMARDSFRDDLERQVGEAVSAGAELLLGGHRIEGRGYFFAPTVLDRVAPGMAVFDEETFGPVAAIVRVDDVPSAIRLANATEFGLGAALWTGDVSRAAVLVREIEAGAVFVNGLVASDPRLPFGGIKRSGYGRELGLSGLREFTNVKTVWIGPARAA